MSSAGLSSGSAPPVPSFSIVIETANLATADPRRLTASLDSLARQDPSPAQAREVILLDAGEAPRELLNSLRVRYPWLSLRGIAAGTDYGDQKALAVSLGSGEIIVFADSDCHYEPGCLASFLETFRARPDVQVLAGETAVAISGPFTLAMALVFFFPRFSCQSEIAPARGFYGNNVAFRRDVFPVCPFPSGLPIYRGQNVIYSRMLRRAGVSLWREPRARSVHSPPEGVWAAIRRFFLTGRDTPRLARLMPTAADAPFEGDYEPYDFPGGRVRKVLKRVRDIGRQQPLRLLLLPLAVPIAVSCVASFFAGVAAERLRPSVEAGKLRQQRTGRGGFLPENARPDAGCDGRARSPDETRSAAAAAGAGESAG